ncbi:hypothetical protein SLS62_004685 [Diatrype stigma]|uniref:Tryptophan synthase beta chain-like PALP domain-containing protein n=1 Tax=Diatrype stigma TaxID=117547 RepID=A0AAN9YTI1_9PEZI
MSSNRIRLNPSAHTWAFEGRQGKGDEEATARVLPFHKSLPDYAETPLRALPAFLARDLGVGRVLLKDESNRFGLPAFKILGASWAVYRAVSSHLGLSSSPSESGSYDRGISLADLGARARSAGLSVVTATEGNCGRAVARTAARDLGIPTRVLVPRYMAAGTRDLIRGEEPRLVEVVEVDGSYEDAVLAMRTEAAKASEVGATDAHENVNVIPILDVSYEGYETVPDYFVQGYSTMLTESDRQVLEATAGQAATHAIVPCGAGSIAQAVTEHFKSPSRRAPPTAVIAVEPTTAACLQASLRAGQSVSVPTADTICCGMNCGVLSSTAWPVLREGVDASVVVDDGEVHRAVSGLKDEYGGILAGPCGAATLAALRRVCADEEARSSLGVGGDSVVVLYCTEGTREYVIPA